MLQTLNMPSNLYSKSIKRRTVKGITIHWWGTPNPNVTFESVVRYLRRADGNTSAHRVIEAGRQAILVPDDRVAWHSGSNKGNLETVGLELNPRASEEDYKTAAEVVKGLREDHGNLYIKGHRDFKATACPGRYDVDQIDRMSRSRDIDPRPAIIDLDLRGDFDMYEGCELGRIDGEPEVYIGNGLIRRHVKDEEELNDIQWRMKHYGVPNEVSVVSRLGYLGEDISKISEHNA